MAGGGRLVIAGGGLAGALAALALAQRRPDVPFLLVEGEDRIGGNHTWSFFDGDVTAEDRWLIDSLIHARWSRHDVIFPKRRRTLPFGYNSITSDRLDAAIRERLRPDQLRLGAPIAAIAADHIVLDGGERIDAAGVIDARGAANLDSLDLGWQKFAGRIYAFDTPHGLDRPIIMDACVDQADGYRFVYSLPFTDCTMLVEDTYYSLSSDLDRGEIAARIDAYAADRGWRAARIIGEESGVLPVAMGGRIADLWEGVPVARLGLRGGFFHPTTGYSLPDAVRNAALLARQQDFGSAALHTIFRKEADRLWRQRGFYRLLNRMLFRAAPPSERYRVLQHFYRLDPALIGRFYAGRTTLLDKVRTLSGRPPVSIMKAMKAL
ncbi:lycopene beta-cyclase CrtY [Allosphingosinicella flava]|uniref:Lycopene beta-cyclase CrtY n=1 Tax=Allosphingosinicella flava TaxID=2771430 RepID=A0A7T2GIL1_9SPHN|nr:lycopene beta-cyclase CrtY [Sphingosinicella flava]QPQ54516.1 lycopene beta-cyclase CrtY [Sphingosinicella flava]